MEFQPADRGMAGSLSWWGRLTLDNDNGGTFQQFVELRLGGDVFYSVCHRCVCCQLRQLWLVNATVGFDEVGEDCVMVEACLLWRMLALAG